MAGYDFAAGMSNNAVSAHESGRVPKSSINRAALDRAGIARPVAYVKWLIERGYFHSDEWHHTGGGYFNRSTFYDLEILAEHIAEGDDEWLEEWKASKATGKPANDLDGKRVRGRFPIWGGSRRRPRIDGYQEFEGVLSGDWIILDGGGRKGARSNGVTYEFIQG